MQSHIQKLNMHIHSASIARDTHLWYLLAILQAGMSIWLVQNTQDGPATTFLAIIVWGGAVICCEDQLENLRLSPSRWSLVAGMVLILCAAWRSAKTLDLDSVVYLLPLIQGMGLIMLVRPIRQIRQWWGSLAILALFPLQPLLYHHLLPEKQLSILTGRLSQLILLLFGENPIVNGRVVQIGNSAVAIGNTCSGIDMIAQLITIACVFCIAFPIKNRLTSLVYIAGSGATAVATNAWRIALLAVISASTLKNEEQLFDFFHSQWGSFIFGGVATMIMGRVYLWLIDRSLR